LTAAAKPGSTVDVDLVRFGAPLAVRVRVDEARSTARPATTLEPERDLLGLQLAPLTARQRERLRVEGGVVVERPGEGGGRAGLLRGDVILSVNSKTVPCQTPSLARALLNAAGKAKPWRCSCSATAAVSSCRCAVSAGSEEPAQSRRSGR
jgi:serine protease Do